MKKAEEDLDYKEAIDRENRMFAEEDEKSKGGLKDRQEKVVKNIEKDLGIKIRNNKKKEVKQMTKVKGGVKTKKTTKTVPPKVDIKEQEKKAIIMLNELRKKVQAGSRKLVLANPPKCQYITYSIAGRFAFGINYSVSGFAPYFLVTKAQFAESKISGKYNGRYCSCKLGEKGISEFAKLAQMAVENFQVAKPKVAKKKAKK